MKFTDRFFAAHSKPAQLAHVEFSYCASAGGVSQNVYRRCRPDVPSVSRWFVALVSAILLTGVGQCVAQGQTLLRGGGATFPYPIYAKWFAEYQKLHPDTEIEYNPIGSGGGIREIMGGTYDFGASDAPMEFRQLKDYHEKRGFDILHFPTVLGADVPTYNVPRRNGGTQVYTRGPRGNLSGENNEMERPGTYEGQS